MLLVILGSTVMGQGNASEHVTLRERLILGEIRPQAYTQSHNAVKTEFEAAVVAGLPVRQHPVNLGLFQIGGCAQCHRINAPLPQENDAPSDVFSQLAEQLSIPTTTPPPNFTRLTRSPGREEFPVWSPDGKHILYSADNNDNHWNLWMVSADGSNPQQLTFATSAGWPSWSPVGKSIVYWATDEENRGNIWIMNSDGSNKQQLTFEEMTAFPQWSPNGNQIVYQARREGKWSIWLVTPDGLTSIQISPGNQVMVGNPQWSPDGTQIFYQARAGNFFEPWRLIFHTGTKGKLDYTSLPDALPSSSLLPMDIGLGQGIGMWSPDGQRVAYLMVNLQILPSGQNALTYKTWLSDIDGSNAELLMPTGTIADRDPTWSPDGQWVAYWSWNPDLVAGIWIVREDGSRAIQLTEGFGADALFPTWSPDGTKIAFAGLRSGSFDIWAASVDEVLSPPTEDLKGKTPEVMCARRSTDLFVDLDQEASGQLIVSSEVSVLEHQGKWVKVRLEGWQEDGVPSRVYALQGIRLREAQLEKSSQEHIKILDMLTDPNTKILWKNILLDGVWVSSEDLTDDLAPVWEEAAQLYEANCSICHGLHDPDHFLANQWPGTIEEMGAFIGLKKNTEQFNLITSYLQYNARDTKDLVGMLPCAKKTQD